VRPQNSDEAKIVVVSEDDQNRILLETRISKDDGYQKQQGTRAPYIGEDIR
jgi:protein phosphatase-4 regulatory subunit 3